MVLVGCPHPYWSLWLWARPAQWVPGVPPARRDRRGLLPRPCFHTGPQAGAWLPSLGTLGSGAPWHPAEVEAGSREGLEPRGGREGEPENHLEPVKPGLSHVNFSSISC